MLNLLNSGHNSPNKVPCTKFSQKWDKSPDGIFVYNNFVHVLRSHVYVLIILHFITTMIFRTGRAFRPSRTLKKEIFFWRDFVRRVVFLVYLFPMNVGPYIDGRSTSTTIIRRSFRCLRLLRSAISFPVCFACLDLTTLSNAKLRRYYVVSVQSCADHSVLREISLFVQR